MPLTFGEVKKIVAPYSGRAGSCPTEAGVGEFARTVMQTLLFSGAHGGLKKITLIACSGTFSLPPEVEIPVRAKVGGRATEIWGKWFSYHSVTGDVSSYPIAESVLMEDGGESPLAYPLLPGGSAVGALAVFEEDPEASIIIQGKDPTGRPIYSFHKGEQIPGVKITLKKGQIKHEPIIFGEITGVLKPKTNGYVSLWAVDPLLDKRQFLADYSPGEEKPLYRRFRLLARDCAPLSHVILLCRMRLKDNYHDNEFVMFDNVLSITMAAQRVQAEKNNDLQTANYKRQAVDESLEREAGFKKISGNPIDIFAGMSGSTVKNIV